MWAEYGTVRRRGSVTLDANGDGTIEFGTQHANQKWVIDSVIVSTDQDQTTAPYPQVVLYLGGQQAGVSEGASWLGNQDVLKGRMEMTSGDNLEVSFTGGVAGSVATAIIEGAAHRWTSAGAGQSG